MRRLTLLFALLGAGCPRPVVEHPAPPVYTLDGEVLSEDEVRAAWTTAASRLRAFRVADATANVEIWLRFHRGDPLLCAGRPPYYTCTARGHDRDVYYVEVNRAAPGTPDLADLLSHEFMHVIMYQLGSPRAQHHPAMHTSGWFIRRSALDVDPDLR